MKRKREKEEGRERERGILRLVPTITKATINYRPECLSLLRSFIRRAHYAAKLRKKRTKRVVRW